MSKVNVSRIETVSTVALWAGSLAAIPFMVMMLGVSIFNKDIVGGLISGGIGVCLTLMGLTVSWLINRKYGLFDGRVVSSAVEGVEGESSAGSVVDGNSSVKFFSPSDLRLLLVCTAVTLIVGSIVGGFITGQWFVTVFSFSLASLLFVGASRISPAS